jgi:hypothetical protein
MAIGGALGTLCQADLLQFVRRRVTAIDFAGAEGAPARKCSGSKCTITVPRVGFLGARFAADPDNSGDHLLLGVKRRFVDSRVTARLSFSRSVRRSANVVPSSSLPCLTSRILSSNHCNVTMCETKQRKMFALATEPKWNLELGEFAP